MIFVPAFIVGLAAALLPISHAFTASPVPALLHSRRSVASPATRRQVAADEYEDVVPRVLKRTEELQLLSKLAEAGLLSKAEKAGLTLSQIEPLLKVVDEQYALYGLEEVAPKIVPALPALLEAAPGLLPVASAVLSTPWFVFVLLSIASFAGGVGQLLYLPDDSVTSVALQTFLFVPLAVILPGVALVTAFITARVQSKS
ncbi:unnamed protein product [Vitrella brassicaformis CCMP3155]|uniref:Uncharacterized protein n=1 Tax=Vitrella brassicaformis (strain CCMP3155) TaxID=1169540 RepID=A0A0G4F6S3_VITBC|nr:unnamed protein product [Vitrella brassicaformis CCMP3155]|eukprot:CEM08122.1 unnamed protein product [Vitrella brassicaformis CCMP3155]